ncbi:extracellular solute-binding protein [uncultured Alsobacter sp.]|uniref:ABC transporter substrate-binding protein n=1 Tax=uncultured Alsobacter sp. TaxID=1748258 RepID=UPI0025D10CE6|nr:extracellular solute-binding protein [uncultured Alsobacter sp.]
MTTLDRRRFGKLILGAGLAAPYGFSRTAVAQPKPGDELVVGIWGGAQERIVKQYVEKPLVEKFGCKVSYVLGGTPERRSRAYAERGRPSFDVLYLNIFESRQAVKDGVTQAPTDAVPQFANLFDVAKLGGYGVALNPCTIVYDKRKASKPITSWKDMWNPEWKGRIAWPSYPGAEGTAGLLMAAKIFGGSEKAIDVGFEKIKELKPFAAIQGSQDQLFQMFDQGVADLSIEFGSFTRKYAETRNPNIEIANPVEGQAVAMNVACITVGTKNQKLAEEWINLHLSEPCMLAYANEIYYSPTVKNLNIPDALKSKLVLGSDVDKLVDFDWDLVIKNQPAWTNRFNREIAG